MQKDLLVFHSPIDATVGIGNAGLIFQATKRPKSYVSLDTADCLLSKRADATYAAKVIAAWAELYINNSDAPEVRAPKAIEETVAVGDTGPSKFSNTVVTGFGHIINVDEPQSVGGDDGGSTPYYLLLAALGACKSMTMRKYAEHKG